MLRIPSVISQKIFAAVYDRVIRFEGFSVAMGRFDYISVWFEGVVLFNYRQNQWFCEHPV